MSAFYNLERTKKSSFKVDYPYYGLFVTSEVTLVNAGGDCFYECKLRNGKIVILKKVHQKWLDTFISEETALSNIIGSSIDDYLKNKPC